MLELRPRDEDDVFAGMRSGADSFVLDVDIIVSSVWGASVRDEYDS